jgi:hypothetical protein
MPTAQYHLKQAQIAARLALVEPDADKAARLNLLALEHFDKAEKAKDGEKSPRPVIEPSGEEEGDRA